MREKLIRLMNHFEKEKEYWLDKLSGEPQIARLSTDISGAGDSRKNSLPIDISQELIDEIFRICKSNDLSIFVLLLAAFKVLVMAYNGCSDIVVASPMLHTRDEIDYNEFLLFRDMLDFQMTFLDVLTAVRNTVSYGYKNQHYPLLEILAGEEHKRLLAPTTMMTMESIHKKETVKRLMDSPTNEITLWFDKTAAGLTGKLVYHEKLFKEGTIWRIIEHYERVLNWVLANMRVKLVEMELVGPTEKSKLLQEFNRTHSHYPVEKTIHELFEDRVSRVPGNIALIWDNKQVTYGELNDKANRLARLLRQKGIGADMIVGLMVESSVEMVMAILGILKAGGAYLPLDPEFPGDRVRPMLEECQAPLLLTQKTFNVNAASEMILVDEIEDMASAEPVENPLEVNRPTDLAYIVFTSGTTGNPKGVLVEHKGIVNYTLWRLKSYHYSEKDVTLQLLSYGFDGFASNFYSSLLSGGILVMVPDPRKLDMDYVVPIITRHGVTNTSAVPGILAALLESAKEEDLKSIRFLVLAGETAGSDLTRKIKKNIPGIKIINEYGPTEGTVTSTAHIGIDPADTTIIGKPIANTRVYILDQSRRLVPIHVAGEIHIAGPGMARGYLGDPSLTADKFITHPLARREKIYRTGDMAKWEPEGTIRFLGRIDRQVKIRGNRVELGEIENRLSRHQAIKEAIVVPRENEKGDTLLCAYIVGKDNAHRIPDAAELNGYLSGQLPHYMIPQYLVPIKTLPLTPNGKIDIKKLPEPQSVMTGVYESPLNDTEEKLAEIWSEILKIDKKRIHRNTNFFDLGGDSIKSILIIARLQNYGLKAKNKDILLKPTLQEMVKCVTPVETPIQQGPVSGEIPLTPIQHFFFQGNHTHSHHFNQGIMLYRKEGFDIHILEKLFKKLGEHHDALRIVFEKKENIIIQVNRTINTKLFDLEVVIIEGGEDMDERIEQKADRIQGEINLSQGPLVKLGLFKTPGGDHLLIVIHHLVVDTVSWRIILEDITCGYRQALKGEEIKFQQKTHSFKYWSERLCRYAQSKELLKQLDYWKAIDSKEVESLRKDHEIEMAKRKMKARHRFYMHLDEQETHRLLKEVNPVYNTEINDILLAALGISLNKWSGIKSFAVNLEGHGREDIIGDVNINRTVGWFTTQFPVVLKISTHHDLAYHIKQVKETLRGIPARGFGYGVLKYLTPPGKIGNFTFALEPEISFNYLGEFFLDNEGAKDKLFEISSKKPGNSISPEMENKFALSIGGMVGSGRLTLFIDYTRYEFDQSNIEALGLIYKSSLIDIIEHCTKKQAIEFTPSDYGLKDMNIQELEEVFKAYEEN